MNSCLSDNQNQKRFSKAPCNFYKGFHVASNCAGFDLNLTSDAHRVLSVLISFPDSWEIWQEDLRQRLGMTHYTFDAAVACCVKAGYVIKTQVRLPSGRFYKNNYEFDSRPIFLNTQEKNDENDPTSGFEPKAVLPCTVNQRQSVMCSKNTEFIEQTNNSDMTELISNETKAKFVCSPEKEDQDKLSLLEGYDLKMSSIIRICKFDVEHIATALKAFEQWRISKEGFGEKLESYDACICKAVENAWKPNNTAESIEKAAQKEKDKKKKEMEVIKNKALKMVEDGKIKDNHRINFSEFNMTFSTARGSNPVTYDDPKLFEYIRHFLE